MLGGIQVVPHTWEAIDTQVPGYDGIIRALDEAGHNRKVILGDVFALSGRCRGQHSLGLLNEAQ